MMACAALMDQRIQPAYSSLLGTPTLPGVNNLKVLIEEAWQHGEYIQYFMLANASMLLRQVLTPRAHKG